MSFSVNLSYQGKTVLVENIPTTTSGHDFHSLAMDALQLSPEETVLKLLFKGKRIPEDEASPAFDKAPTTKTPKILVVASARTSVEELNSKKQDPTIRGFDQEKKHPAKGHPVNPHWGALSQLDGIYKFGRLEECSLHSFGHRPSDATPHAFAARQLLEKLATDPGVLAVLEERQLTVNTLGEMDPIDDRLMQKKQAQNPGSCLLGYNTNHGLRIDVKLRTDDLKGFRPYPQLVSTLIHELSHNWIGEHNIMFWANYGQMRVEYLMRHKRLQGSVANGKTSAELAGLTANILNNILEFVGQELQKEMMQHGLHPDMIADSIRQRYEELQPSLGQTLGGNGGKEAAAPGDKRNLALEAAERRAREQKEKEKGSDRQ